MSPRPARQCPRPGCRKTQPCDTHPQGWQAKNPQLPKLPDNWEALKKMAPKTGCRWLNTDGTLCNTWTSLQLDHIIPRYVGGTDSLVNLQWLCKHHHYKKTALDKKKYGKFKG